MASLRVYLIAVIFMATVPLGVLTFILVKQEVASAHNQVYGGLQRGAGALAMTVEREIVSSVDALTILSYGDSLQDNNLRHFHGTLKRMTALLPNWEAVFLVDLQGRIVLSSQEPFGSRVRPWEGPWQPTVMAAQRQPMVLGLASPASGGELATSIQVPVVIKGGVRYVLVASISSSAWRKLLREADVPPGGFVTLFDDKDTVIARSVHPERFEGRPLPARNIELMASRPSGLQKAELMGGGDTYAAWHRIAPIGWGVAIGVPAEPMDQAYFDAMAAAIAVCLLSLFAGVGLSLVVAGRVKEPLEKLACGGPAAESGYIAVTEIARLRDALVEGERRREQARARLQAKADEFEALFNSSPIGLAMTQDTRCKNVLRNPALEAMFGETWGANTVLGRVLHRGRQLDPEDQPLQRAAGGEAVANMELEVHHPDGRQIKLLAHAVPLLDAKGLPRGAIGTFVDITERVSAEERLIRAERSLRESRHLVDLAEEIGDVGFSDHNIGEGTIQVTKGVARLLGVPTEAISSSRDDWLKRLVPEDRALTTALMTQVWKQRLPEITFRFRVMRPDGSLRWLSSRMVVTYESGEAVRMIGVSVDITDQHAAEQIRARFAEQQQAARLEAESANRAKDEFLAMLGHELRNPLGAIAAAVEVLNRIEPGHDAGIRVREIISRQTRHLVRLMDDLLDVARVVTGKIILARQPMNLGAQVQRVVDRLRLTEEGQQHQLTLEYAEGWVEGDAFRLEQVITNLLSNALKYTPGGGRISVRVWVHDEQVILEVADTGPGIPPALQSRVFDLFVQGERSLDRREGGLGIGLTLVRRLVELHGGSVALVSSSAGSVFSVTLPRAVPPEAARHMVSPGHEDHVSPR